jgi:hypothetical protein
VRASWNEFEVRGRGGVRPNDADTSQQSGRRRQCRFQSAVSDWWSAIGATGPEARVLSQCTGPVINPAAFTIPTRALQRRPGMKCPARVRRHECRLDAAEAVQTPRADYPQASSGSFQHPQPPQFRPAHKLPEFSSIRAIHWRAVHDGIQNEGRPYRMGE